jgi:hypothetical protein
MSPGISRQSSLVQTAVPRCFPALVLLFLSPTICLQPTYATSPPPSSVLCPPHLWLLSPLFPCLIQRPFPGPKLVTLLLSPTDTPCCSVTDNGKWWVGLQVPTYSLLSCILATRPALLATGFMLLSCLVSSWTLKIQERFPHKIGQLLQDYRTLYLWDITSHGHRCWEPQIQW